MKGVLVVMTDAVVGKDAEFNNWYDTVHIPHVLSVPGFAAAQRFAAAPWAKGQPPEQQGYMTLYELDVVVEEALAAMAAARPRMAPVSPALEPSTNVVYAYRSIRERVLG